MWKCCAIGIVLLLAGATGDAQAQSGSFQTSIRLVSARPVAMPGELPLPPGAQILPPSRSAKRYLFPGHAEQARRFYTDRLPALGFQLAQQRADGAVWERGDVRAEVLFHPVVGGRVATGIIVMMSPMPSATTPTAH